MAGIDRKGFHTVGNSTEEIEEKIYQHRKDVFWRTMWTLMILIIVLVAFAVWTALRTFDSYEVTGRFESGDSTAAQFLTFGGNIVKYSNDGIVYMDKSGELIWNQSYEMNTPCVHSCKNYVIVYDLGGTALYIMDREGVQQQIVTTTPILKARVAGQGTVAVLLKENAVSKVQLYDKRGKQLANGEFYGDQGGFPTDIAFSYDAQKLAVDMVDVSDGNVKTTISFYNFGSVGQNEVNKLVGTYSFSDLFVPQIDYVSDDKMIAFGDSEIILFAGDQKPAITKEVYVQSEIRSVFHNERYFGIVRNDPTGESQLMMTVYDMRGNEVMSHGTDFIYENIEFLDNNEVCLRNQNACELYSVHGIKKFAYTFDTRLLKILSEDIGANYILVMEGETEEVHLQ